LFFLLDGYNLLFSWIEGNESIESKRQKLVKWIQDEFKNLNLLGMIIFDGSHRSDEESGLSYPSPMEVAYTPKGQSADENILQRVEARSNRKNVIVVTDDRGLKNQARALGAEIMGNSDFIQWISKRERKKNIDKFQHKDSPHQIKRLTKIFEERLKKTDFEG